MHRFLQTVVYLAATVLLAAAVFSTPIVNETVHAGIPGGMAFMLLSLAGLALAVGVVMVASLAPDRPVVLKPKQTVKSTSPE